MSESQTLIRWLESLTEVQAVEASGMRKRNASVADLQTPRPVRPWLARPREKRAHQQLSVDQVYVRLDTLAADTQRVEERDFAPVCLRSCRQPLIQRVMSGCRGPHSHYENGYSEGRKLRVRYSCPANETRSGTWVGKKLFGRNGDSCTGLTLGRISRVTSVG